MIIEQQIPTKRRAKTKRRNLAPQPNPKPCSADRLQPGDLVFTTRPGHLQKLVALVDDPWRHVGIVVELDGDENQELAMVEVAGDRFLYRSIEAVASSSTLMGIARVRGNQGAARQVAERARLLVDQGQRFAWDDAVLTAFVAATRHRWETLTDRQIGAIGRAERVVSEAQTRGGPHPMQSYTCSGFVAAAFTQVGYPIELDLARRPQTEPDAERFETLAHWRALRSAGGTRISSRQLRATIRSLTAGVAGYCRPDGATVSAERQREIMDRWASPSDLWRSPSLTDHVIVGDRSATDGPLPTAIVKRSDQVELPA